MKNSINKTIAAGLALAGVDAVEAAVAPSSGNVILIGAGVEPAGSTGATVYSIDAYDSSSNAISLASAVTSGAVLSTAINALTPSGLGASGTGFLLVGSNTVNIANTGYALQQYKLQFTSTTVGNATLYGFVGAGAPSATGSTVYSIDALDVNGNKITNITNNVTTGWQTSRALNKLAASNTVSATVPNLQINGPGYSLQQFIITTP